MFFYKKYMDINFIDNFNLIDDFDSIKIYKSSKYNYVFIMAITE